MQVAINYSRQAADLVKGSQIPLDMFKCPAWPETVTEALRLRPTYVHFPLSTMRGEDAVLNGETGAPADLDQIGALQRASDTHLVNVHFSPKAATYPEFDHSATDADMRERILVDAVRSIQALQRRVGTENVIVENVPDAADTVMHAALLPEVISELLERTGCGLLLDLSHARIAADFLGQDPHDYVQRLPVSRLRELHVTGIQQVDEELLARIEKMGLEETIYHRLIGRMVDHLPFSTLDWQFMDWAVTQIQAGFWAEPWVVAFEYGGIGSFWEKIGDATVMAEQVPRLYRLFKGDAASSQSPRS